MPEILTATVSIPHVVGSAKVVAPVLGFRPSQLLRLRRKRLVPSAKFGHRTIEFDSVKVRAALDKLHR